MNNGNYNYTEKCNWCGLYTTSDESNDIPVEMPTLRDHFAMATLTGLLAKWVDEYPTKLNIKETRERLATKCYKIADAMLEARK
jgi:hypothetical protein